MAVKFMSLNARGLNIPYKRRPLLKDMQRLNCDVLFVQETHFVDGELMRLKHKQIPYVYKASSPSKKRGVLIAIKDSVTFKLQDCISDLYRNLILFYFLK